MAEQERGYCMLVLQSGVTHDSNRVSLLKQPHRINPAYLPMSPQITSRELAYLVLFTLKISSHCASAVKNSHVPFW